MHDRPTRPALARLALLAAALAVVGGACGQTAEPSATGALASPIATASPDPFSTAPAATSAPSATPVATPAPSGAGTTDPAAGDVTPEAFWATVRRGLATDGHLVVTADGPAPVEIRYREDASEALVGGALVSRCVGTRSWAGDAGSLAPVPGLWRCGAEALVAGFRATAAPIDSWSPDFPVEGSPAERVSGDGAGPWTWSYSVADSLDGPIEATLTLDPATGRILVGSRTDASGTTTWTFDYATVVDPIVAP